jgi:ankyrin repeat protein
MTKIFISYFKKAVYLYVLIGFGICHAGSYDDFFKAIKMDDSRAIQQLLARGFDANTLDPQGQHGLLVAIKEPSPKAAKALVDAPKIDLNTLNVLGESPLMLAALKGDLELASQMVKKGADVNKTGWTPLHYAASNGHVAVIKLLLESYAYIDAESPNATTPLMMASMYGSPEAVKLLLDEGADPILKNQQGLTALDFAQRGNRPDSMALLSKAARSKQATGKW